MLDTMKKLDETGQRILFIAPEGKLKAVVTDGDIRKCILRGGALSAPLTQAANYHPHSLPVAERGRARAELQRLGIDALPILDKHGVITDIVFAGGVDVDNRKKVDIPVVMMAGGLGTRLYPYTKILPKPLIPVGEQPIAELIFSRFRDFGCRHMTMIVNYKRGMIKSYFADLEKDYTVDFIDEDVFMGTGGGLCLLKGRMDSPFFFTNCDTLLDLDYGDLYQYHKAHGNLVTMVCAFKHYVVPYGVVELRTRAYLKHEVIEGRLYYYYIFKYKKSRKQRQKFAAACDIGGGLFYTIETEWIWRKEELTMEALIDFLKIRVE